MRVFSMIKTFLAKQAAGALNAVAKKLDPSCQIETRLSASMLAYNGFNQEGSPTTTLTFDVKPYDASELLVFTENKRLIVAANPYHADAVLSGPNLALNLDISEEDVEALFQRIGYYRYSTLTIAQFEDFRDSVILKNLPLLNGNGNAIRSPASQMLTALVKALIDRRDRYAEKLTADTIFESLQLDRYAKIAHDDLTSVSSRERMMAYLSSAPGYSEEDYSVGILSPKVYEYHGHLVMQIMHTRTALAHSIDCPERILNRTEMPPREKFIYDIGAYKSVSAYTKDDILHVCIARHQKGKVNVSIQTEN